MSTAPALRCLERLKWQPPKHNRLPGNVAIIRERLPIWVVNTNDNRTNYRHIALFSPEASLHHGREHEYRHCPIRELVRRAYLVEELTERRLHLRLNLGLRCGRPYSRPNTHSNSPVSQ